MTSPWQLWLLWGFAVGIGTGALALVFGAIIANRWFVRHRGVVVGVFSAASSTGQLVFLPAIAQLADGPGWRWAAGLVCVFALLLVPLVWAVLRDSPADAGTTAYGADPDAPVAPPAPSTEPPARMAIRILRESRRSRTFWCLIASFWICGWSTNGLIGTHFIPAAHDHGMPADDEREPARPDRDLRHRRHGGQWMADRPGGQPLPALHVLLLPRPVAAGRAVAAGGHVHPSLFVFIVFYGLDWVATVPPTVALCRQHFGIERSGVVFGWVFAATWSAPGSRRASPAGCGR